ncbi:Pyruvate decarboxylase [Purpureocillium takamizusanense]|uniref:Pyruvate decarboxylase n=1 Tax=Purpureocillium takamizusanense TaxID=2060973 RepID=A0A9Q8Q5U1_9HYPO|nr:Pyruvate decarboxylase [Purpureocillium takamizusanense]UNI13590.1 Pyruvate decarboxylase [Purpureocillium takamizusanense]
MASTIQLADYLFLRLRQLGVGAIHGVPGDYNLTLLDHVEPSGLRWVGNANEFNAGYAADGYARIKGLGALVTTFGVGELSAINAIAGAYTERAAVVHIVGTPPRAAQDSRLLIHHTFNDGEYGRFAQMHAHVTVAQTRLRDPRMAPRQIDEVLRQCLLYSRPVYIEMPVDLVAALVPDETLRVPLIRHEVEELVAADDLIPGLDQVLDEILRRIETAKQPVILVDGEIRPMGIVGEVQQVVDMTGWPTWTSTFGKGLLNETISNFHGVYQGSYGSPAVHAFVQEADLVLFFGPHLSSTNTYAFSSIPPAEATISFTDTEVKMGAKTFRDVPARVITSLLVQRLGHSSTSSSSLPTTTTTTMWKRYDPYPDLPRDYSLSLTDGFVDDTATSHLTQDKLWRVLANFLCPGDIVLGETGTAGYGVREMPLPRHVRVFAPVTWLSIGYMLPGAQGAALAQRELAEESSSSSSSLESSAAARYSGLGGVDDAARTVLFIGDGSFQMTAQELATIIRLRLNVVIFLINNDGYTIERCIHGRRQGYNDVSPWRYLQAPSFFGAGQEEEEGGAYTCRASTWAELREILNDDRVADGRGLRMIELMVGREDAPQGLLRDLLEKQKARSES